jgi:hypothetical protein
VTRKFTVVLDDIRPALRNAIAHLDPDGNLLIQDRWDDLQKVEQALRGVRTLGVRDHLLSRTGQPETSLAILDPENTRVRTGDRSGRGAFGSDYGAVVGTNS